MWGAVGGMKDRKLFPQVWGLRLFLLPWLPGPAGPGAAAASPPVVSCAPREKAEVPKASLAPAGRMLCAEGRRVETPSLKFLHCLSSKFRLDKKAGMLLLSIIVIIIKQEFPVRK